MSPFWFAQFPGQTYTEAKNLRQTQPKWNYVARLRSDKGASDRGGRRLPVARVGRMSICRSRIARRSVFRCKPSFSWQLALIPSLILQHRKDEDFLKFPHRFRASHPGFIHLQDDTL